MYSNTADCNNTHIQTIPQMTGRLRDSNPGLTIVTTCQQKTERQENVLIRILIRNPTLVIIWSTEPPTDRKHTKSVSVSLWYYTLYTTRQYNIALYKL